MNKSTESYRRQQIAAGVLGILLSVFLWGLCALWINSAPLARSGQRLLHWVVSVLFIGLAGGPCVMGVHAISQVINKPPRDDPAALAKWYFTKLLRHLGGEGDMGPPWRLLIDTHQPSVAQPTAVSVEQIKAWWKSFYDQIGATLGARISSKDVQLLECKQCVRQGKLIRASWTIQCGQSLTSRP
jgi:hypothetical protein